MIFRLTQRLGARVKIEQLETAPPHGNPLLDWSGHLFTVGRTPFIILSHTATLLSAVVPGRGVSGEPGFRAAALGAIEECLKRYGVGEDRRHVSPLGDFGVRYAKTLNRSVSGSMNDLIRQAELWLSESELSPEEVSDRLNTTLLSALAVNGSRGYGRPEDAFLRMVSDRGGRGGAAGSGADEH